MKYDVNLEPDEDGIWTAEVPALGIVTEGRGEAAARRAADRAIVGYLEGLERHGLAIPPSDVTRTFVPRVGSNFSVAYGFSLLGGTRKKSSAAKKTAVNKSLAKSAAPAKKAAKTKSARSPRKRD
jgi:predicted RNase H-like HicB family nuclease